MSQAFLPFSRSNIDDEEIATEEQALRSGWITTGPKKPGTGRAIRQLDLPLRQAYSLLSISYAFVYLLAVSLPLFNEAFSLSKTFGVALVILGVITLNSRLLARKNSGVPNENQRIR